jgi:DNA-binding response OmpR family regulator
MAAAIASILIIDDDEALRDTIAVMLEGEGFHVSHAADGRHGFERALAHKPDLILVDLRLPAMGGLEICQKLRAAGVDTPIIVLSALGDEIEKVLLLESGADDYVVKPFGPRELLARVRAVLRRSTGSEKPICFGENEFDFERRSVRRHRKQIQLTAVEYNLLAYFLRNPDRALSRDAILRAVWGEGHPDLRTVDAYVAKLREKLEEDPKMPRHFVTVVGAGYRFLA